MCSWCWAFRPTWKKVKEALPNNIGIHYLLGGLAPDNEDQMHPDMQEHIRGNWKKIQEEIPDIEFNYDFWTLNTPKRSTYAACRAVICAKNQSSKYETLMIEGIQNDYYLNAKNPSDYNVLISIAKRIGLDKEKFIKDLNSADIIQSLIAEIKITRALPINGFPSIILKNNNKIKIVKIDYRDPNYIINQIIPCIKTNKWQ